MVNNIHLYPSPIISESRIFKESQSLIKLNLVTQVLILGIARDNLPKYEQKYKRVEIRRLNLWFASSQLSLFRYLSFLEYLLKSCLFVIRRKPEVLNCHSLHVLLVGVFYKLVHKSGKLIYDAHELETEVNGSKGMLRWFSKILERFCFRFVDEFIVVNHSIGRWYKQNYGVPRYTAIYNVPNAFSQNHKLREKSPGYLRKKLGLDSTELLCIYQGLLSQVRGVDEILSAFSSASSLYNIVFMGSGPLESQIIKASNEQANIHYHPPVEMKDVLSYTQDADIGIHIIKNTCLNHYYCLPNKIFEYLLAGVPFVVSNFPEMANIVHQTNAGWLTEPDGSSLMHTINSIKPVDLQNKKTNAQQSRTIFSWETEELKYREVFQSLCGLSNQS